MVHWMDIRLSGSYIHIMQYAWILSHFDILDMCVGVLEGVGELVGGRSRLRRRCSASPLTTCRPCFLPWNTNRRRCRRQPLIPSLPRAKDVYTVQKPKHNCSVGKKCCNPRVFFVGMLKTKLRIASLKKWGAEWGVRNKTGRRKTWLRWQNMLAWSNKKEVTICLHSSPPQIWVKFGTIKYSPTRI